MTTDITELALIAKIKKQTENFDTVVLKEWEALALVEALEKAQQRIAELDIKNCELDSLTQRWAVERAENADRIAELESRTVTVKLPEPPGPMSVGARTVYFGIVADVVSAFQYGLTAAGIKVEVE